MKSQQIPQSCLFRKAMAGQAGAKGVGARTRSLNTIAVVRQKVYAFGGEFKPRVAVNNHLYVFDPDEQTWSVAYAKGDIPPPRVSVTMASIDGPSMSLVGGTGPRGS